MGCAAVTLSQILALAVAYSCLRPVDGAVDSSTFSSWLGARLRTDSPVADGPVADSPVADAPDHAVSTDVSLFLDSKDVKEIVDEHNKFRAVEKVGPLKWNTTLEKYAHEYAAVRKGDCALKHSEGEYGENIFEGSGTDWTWPFAVQDWAAEKKHYDYAGNSCADGEMCGHYTQVVWSHTTDVGCGRVNCDNGSTFIVCSYYPPGNCDDEKPF